jgi:hypothetical protein
MFIIIVPENYVDGYLNVEIRSGGETF